MTRLGKLVSAAALLVAAGCGPTGAPVRNIQDENETIETVDIPQTVTEIPAGTTPMPERVAVLGLLNKRNGLSRDLTLRPGGHVARSTGFAWRSAWQHLRHAAAPSKGWRHSR